jgi:hypothetical protein
MCTQESGSLGAKGPAATQANSEHSGSDGSESDDSNNNRYNNSQGGKRRSSPTNENDTATAKTAISNISMSVMNGILHGVVWVVVALQLPFILNRNEATVIYRPAYYKYSTELSLFDNTIWTYGTDYALCIIMTSLACWILSFRHNRGTGNNGNGNDVKRLCYLSASMLLLYAISVLAGGIAHQNFHTVESRNTILFRIIWTTCVGTVCLAPASMGMIGSECIRLFKNRKDCPSILKSMPLISDTYWTIYGLVVTIACGLGAMSFQRPACDIFIGGITQTSSTFYCMAFLYTMKHYNNSKSTSNSKKIHIHPHMKIMGLIGFILNATLLPIYPVLVLHLGWTLPSVNTFLHSCLCMAWSMQGFILQHVIRALVVEGENNNNIEILEEQQQKPLKMKKVQ